MGLLVDIVLQGHGTTNDGNTARKFFKNFEKSAKITNIDEELIKKFGNILMVLASDYEIDTESFKNYCLDTAKYYITLYPWYNMPASVHKILIHGADVIQHALLPIGQLSEEAQECRNKDFKIFRQHHSRKNSRINNNEDLVHMLCVSSDPVISSLRNVLKKNILKLSDEAQNLTMIHPVVVRQKKRMMRGGDLAKDEKPKHRVQKFRSEWKTDKNFRYWIERDTDETKAKCTFCKVSMVSEGYFSLLTDESTDIGTIKTACVVVRYYDKGSKRIESTFWELHNVFDSNNPSSATAQHLYNGLINT
ncbi:uncharacterized protein LOC132945941 [Metopolophium dirhodum]|uniref:uncharacterized protein LOC132945941 n=1 Tax=Metopolophium dirhodum TaxID=44670 RepID=UPI00298F7A51|nr:uncharacterized protein LOC132945941 [Metopolophium dirhodum]